MVRILRACMQSLLKFVNSGNGMVGIAMILYGIWLMRAWQRHLGHLPYEGPSDPIPWFMYSFLGLGILLCVITCLGHIAAETANGCCLHLYMLLLFMVIMVEAGVTTDVFLNRDWAEDFPKDPSGCFDQFKHFIKSNFNICKWIGISTVSIQGLSLLLAMVLKAIGSRRYYESDDEYAPERLPFLKNALHSPTTCVIGDPVFPSKNDTWNKRTDDEV
ncbi:tetraspanin-19 [Cucumis melo var. makuwa]|uniref:Tetraspanin-19 n=1 Tax=Cucumis melo var. makuwa TaxID=1194695 RepID=A0A5D3C188_CUCMM|nr:tetraspanin-19 [Cucumis melo var. makuwa]TYK04942.1 tetraspanin-19 [Cucumis melo var. makuwa]